MRIKVNSNTVDECHKHLIVEIGDGYCIIETDEIPSGVQVISSQPSARKVYPRISLDGGYHHETR